MCNTRVLRCADTSILGLALVVSITSTAPVRASDCLPCTAAQPPVGGLYPITVVNNIVNSSYSSTLKVKDGQIWLHPSPHGGGTWYYQKASSPSAAYCKWPSDPNNGGLPRPLSLGEINGTPNNYGGRGTVWVSRPAKDVLQAFVYDCTAAPPGGVPIATVLLLRHSIRHTTL